jgi:hypothetical protein
MPGLPVLDVAIGLAFLYLLFALSCTTLNEAIALVVNRRAVMLRMGIEQLLGDKTLTSTVYQHPSIASLVNPKSQNAKPSYIPAERFAAALTDHITSNGSVDDATAIEAGIKALPAAASKQLTVLFELSKKDPAEFQKRVAGWFNEMMDRTSGWYKRTIQRQTYVLAAVLVLALNLDSVQLFNRLWSDTAFRTAAVEQAKARIAATGTAEVPVMEYADADSIDGGTPVQTGTVALTDSETQLLTSLAGWQPDRQRLSADIVLGGDGWGVRSAWLARSAGSHLLGWFITILAISLGAPFWFDVLNRFMNLRNTGRAPDESRSKA